jgi:hypothetical protein
VVEVVVVGPQSYLCPMVGWLQLYKVTMCHRNSCLGGEIIKNAPDGTHTILIPSE